MRGTLVNPTDHEWDLSSPEPSHDRSQFHCGHAALDEWIQRYAGQNHRSGISRVYVAVCPGTRNVLGYYAVSSHHLRIQSLNPEQAKRIPKADVPVVLLGRLAVDESVQGQGLGSILLVHALRTAHKASQSIGIRAVEVEAIDDDDLEFYLRFGFEPLLDDSRHLYLSIDWIKKHIVR